MISVSVALAEIVLPATKAVFRDDEVTAITVELDPDYLGGSIRLSLTAMGETFTDLVVQGNIEGGTIESWRERLRSDMADFVAESAFGWGQDRGV